MQCKLNICIVYEMSVTCFGAAQCNTLRKRVKTKFVVLHCCVVGDSNIFHGRAVSRFCKTVTNNLPVNTGVTSQKSWISSWIPRSTRRHKETRVFSSGREHSCCMPRGRRPESQFEQVGHKQTLTRRCSGKGEKAESSDVRIPSLLMLT